MREWLHRILQRQDAGRVACQGDILFAKGGTRFDRNVRKHYNTVRPHSSLGYRPPAPETIVGIPSQKQPFSLTL
jgi:Integrase core domain